MISENQSIEEILSGPDYFYCERYKIRMKKIECVRRQTAPEPRSCEIDYTSTICNECEQGEVVKAETENQGLEARKKKRNPPRLDIIEKVEAKRSSVDNSGEKASDRGLKSDQKEHIWPEKLKISTAGKDQNSQERNNKMVAVKFKNEKEAKEYLGDNLPGEEKPMEEKNKKKVCLICGGKHSGRGLCNKHYLAWKAGKIKHPRYGDWKISEHGKNMLKSKKLNQTGSIIVDIDPVLSALRKRLKESKSLAESLIILGQGDCVKKEIEIFAQRFV